MVITSNVVYQKYMNYFGLEASLSYIMNNICSKIGFHCVICGRLISLAFYLTNQFLFKNILLQFVFHVFRISSVSIVVKSFIIK